MDLYKAYTAIQANWHEFQSLPDKLKEDWEAYEDLRKALKKNLDAVPVLMLLSEKEIRSRHWLQVMQVTKSAFRLEAFVFKINDLIDIELDLYEAPIRDICKAAKKEQELEIKMRSIEEEWNEQVLVFISFKSYGEICFEKEYTERLLEQLEDAQETLANMLTSKYVAPLRVEVAGWSEKLKTLGEVLELWLEVQELWLNIEWVFTNPATMKEMPVESKRYSRAEKSWQRSQKQSLETKNVLQCCLGSSAQENSKRMLLKDIQKEFEICFKSLGNYLDKKRRAFPRYYFLSNSALLSLLSYAPSGDELVAGRLTGMREYFNSLFSSVADVKCDECMGILNDNASETGGGGGGSLTTTTRRALDAGGNPPSLTLAAVGGMTRKVSTLSFTSRSSVSKEHNTSMGALAMAAAAANAFAAAAAGGLGGSGAAVSSSNMELSELYSSDGEVFALIKRVSIERGPEQWLPRLKEAIAETLKQYLRASLLDLNDGCFLEELPLKYPAQICLVGLSYLWTKEVETSIIEFKNERKSVSFGSKKFGQVVTKLTARLGWTSVEKPILNYQKLRIQTLISVIHTRFETSQPQK